MVKGEAEEGAGFGMPETDDPFGPAEMPGRVDLEGGLGNPQEIVVQVGIGPTFSQAEEWPQFFHDIVNHEAGVLADPARQRPRFFDGLEKAQREVPPDVISYVLRRVGVPVTYQCFVCGFVSVGNCQ